MTLHNTIGRPRKYAFAELKPGEGVFMPSDCDNLRRFQHKMANAAARQAGGYGHFSVIQRSLKGVDGVKVTRKAI